MRLFSSYRSGWTSPLMVTLGLLFACTVVASINPDRAYAVTNATMCMNDNVAENNVVVFVKMYAHDANVNTDNPVRYSNDFKFKVESYSARSGGPSLDYGRFKHNAIIGWNDGVETTYGRNGTTVHAKLGGDGQPLPGKGNLCDPNGDQEANRKLAYAFRSGDGTKKAFASGMNSPDGSSVSVGKDHNSGYINNGSLSLSCLTLPETAYRYTLTDVENGSLAGTVVDGFQTQESSTPNATGKENAVNGAQIRVVFKYRLPPPITLPEPSNKEWNPVPGVYTPRAVSRVGVSSEPVTFRYSAFGERNTVNPSTTRVTALVTDLDGTGRYGWKQIGTQPYGIGTWLGNEEKFITNGLVEDGWYSFNLGYGAHGTRVCAQTLVKYPGGDKPDGYTKYGAAWDNAFKGFYPATYQAGTMNDTMWDHEDGQGSSPSQGSQQPCVTVVEEYSISPLLRLSVNGAEVSPGAEAGPGQTVSWQHGYDQEGPGSTQSNLPQFRGGDEWGIHLVRSGNGGGSDQWFTGRIDPADKWDASDKITNVAIGQDDVGTNLCRKTTTTPTTGQDGAARSVEKCIAVPYNYRIVPTVSLTDTEAEAEATISTANVSVNFPSPFNGRNPTKTRGTEWQLNTFVLAPGNLPTPANEVSTAPVSYYSYKAGSWNNVSSGTGKVFIPGSDEALANASAVIGNEPVGSKFCFVLSVKEARSDIAPRWGHSQPACAIIGIKPKLQIRGNDVKVGKKINTGVSRLGGKTYGSFGEYGVVSGLVNKGMGSGSGLVTGNDSAAQEVWSKLTFANIAGGIPRFGSYGAVPPFVMNDNGATVINGNTSLPAGGQFASPWGANAKLIVKVNGTLTITDDLVYSDGPYASISQIPRIVIIANDIVIESDVKRIDAWLAADRIATCNDANDAGNYFVSADRVRLDVNTCNEPLVFNGPVVANRLFPYRTTNTGKDTNNAAEIFNLRADAFLSAYAGGGLDNPVASTDLVTDLPPRF